MKQGTQSDSETMLPVDSDQRCTCGSGGHPRRCALHPLSWDSHIAELNFLGALDDPEPEGTPQEHLAEIRRQYDSYEKAQRADLRQRFELAKKTAEDRDYWRSRALALEADRRSFLLAHGIDLGERPTVSGTGSRKGSRE